MSGRVTEMGHDPTGCPDCGRRHDAVYRCTTCGYKYTSPGRFEYFPQGHGHFHVPDDQDAQNREIDHLHEHGVPGHDGVFIPHEWKEAP